MTITNNPHSDVEKMLDEDEADQAAHDERLAEAKRIAPGIVFAMMQACKLPKDWTKPNNFTGATWSADEIANWAIQKDDNAFNKYLELMISPAAEEFLKAASDWFGEEYALDVMDEHCREGGEL